MAELDQVAHQRRHALGVVGADERRVDPGMASSDLDGPHVAQQRPAVQGEIDRRIEQDARDARLAEGDDLGFLDGGIVLRYGQQQIEFPKRAGFGEAHCQGAEEIRADVRQDQPEERARLAAHLASGAVHDIAEFGCGAANPFLGFGADERTVAQRSRYRRVRHAESLGDVLYGDGDMVIFHVQRLARDAAVAQAFPAAAGRLRRRRRPELRYGCRT